MNLKLSVFSITIFMCLVFERGQSANILFWMPSPNFSHQVFAKPIAKELSLRGHNVTFITPNPIKDSKLTNLTEIDVSYAYKVMQGLQIAVTNGDWGFLQYKIHWELMPEYVKVFEAQLKDPLVVKALHGKYDVFLAESNVHSALPWLKQILKCPVIMTASLFPNREGYAQVGDYLNPSYETNFFLPYRRPKGFLDKIVNIIQLTWDYLAYEYLLTPINANFLKAVFNESVIDYSEQRKVDLVLSNTHPILTGVRADFPNVINVGGILKKSIKPLPQDLQTVLDNSPNGVIYFSFGTNVLGSLQPLERQQQFIDAFKRLPYTVLWKYENDTLPNKPPNVKISKWFPQFDVLSHPNVKLFITQGGLQSFEEAIHAKVPMIGIPFMGDQHWNIDHMVSLGIGLQLDRNTMESDSIFNAINEIMNNDRYAQKASEVCDLLNDNPLTPLESCIYWIEYVIKHKGASLLQSPHQHNNWFQNNCLDVLLFLLVLLLCIIYLLIYTIVKCYGLAFKKAATKKKRKIKVK